MAHFLNLINLNLDLHKSLVDKDGFPREDLDFGELTFVELIVYFMTKHEKSTRSKWNDKIRENSFVSHWYTAWIAFILIRQISRNFAHVSKCWMWLNVVQVGFYSTFVNKVQFVSLSKGICSVTFSQEINVAEFCIS